MHVSPAVFLAITMVSSCAGVVLNFPVNRANRLRATFKSFQPRQRPYRPHASTREVKELKPTPEQPAVSRRDIKLTNFNNNMVYGTIAVGTPGQELNIVFDTGPGPMWILSSHGRTHLNWENHRKYNNDSSSTYRNKHKSFAMKYDFGILGGYIGQDCVAVAGLTVENQQFGEAVVVDLDMLAKTDIDGIVGLGFRNMTRGVETNLLDNMVSQGLLPAPVFSFYLSREEEEEDGHGSTLTLGGANPDFFRGNFKFANLTAPDRWQFKMDRVQLPNGADTFGESGCEAEVVSTSSAILGPYTDVYYLNTKLGAKQILAPGPYMYEFDCSKVDWLPDVEFILNGEKLALSSKDYVIKMEKDGTIVCYSAFKGRIAYEESEEKLWTLGQVFMRGFYTYFDKGNHRIGFAKARR
ncbi:cathepsin d [Plakobranchus ocellatus]|uniref:Cathepsin d n=1 Tax=Plakobranchus ocellatus TaxID=259542 RepID=A0AAV4CY10_9GAST|nr:cathepsin d [Plakobranchus ocellatus]